MPVSDGGRTRKRPAPQKTEEVEEVAVREETSEDVIEDADELLDEIDEVLEENAEEFIKNYVQKGGE
ncbi:MAG: ubiquitin-like protein Pup [Nitriliruptorales bacterium]